MRVVLGLVVAVLQTVAASALAMGELVSGGDVLTRCETRLLASSLSTPAVNVKVAANQLPSDISAALAAHSLQWDQLPDLVRVGVLWAHGYVLQGFADGATSSSSSTLLKVYTSCGDASSAGIGSTSEEARGLAMDQIAVSSPAFFSTQCLNNTCGVYHQSTNTNCGPSLPTKLLCAVEQISVPALSTGSFWSNAGDGSTEAPYPEVYTHSIPVTNGNNGTTNVTFASIHMNRASAQSPPSCSTTGDTVIPCLHAANVAAGSRVFCRPQVDASRLKTFLTAAATKLQKSSSHGGGSPVSTISNKADGADGTGGGLSTGAILGIAGGALVVLGIVAFYFLRKKTTPGDHFIGDAGGGFGDKTSVDPRGNHGGRTSNGGFHGGGGGSDFVRSGATSTTTHALTTKPLGGRFGRDDSMFPIIDSARDNESVISTDFYREASGLDAGNSSNNSTSRSSNHPPSNNMNMNHSSGAGSSVSSSSNRAPFLASKQSSSSSTIGGSSRGAMYGKSLDEYCDESETIREFLTDPQILMRRIPYEELTPLRLLSKGSYGEVFLAQLETRHVATKRLLPEKKSLTRSIEQFTAEIRLMCVLEHRNIVSFVGVSWDYLQNLSAVVEYMDNGDLAEVLARSKHKFSWHKEKISIAMDVAEGLVYLHAMRPVIVHRDLKSKNVLLNKRGQAKLSDFGVSRKTTVNETMTSGVGTLLWTAPEIIEGRKYSEKADIFSLGVVLSEIDTCEMPYASTKDEYGDRLPGMQIVQMVRLGELTVSFESDCPSRVRELAQQCTSLDPDARPTSMEVAYTLKSIIAPALRAAAAAAV